MPSTSTSLIGIEEVKSLLPIRAGNAEFDARITNLVTLASRQIEQATKRFFTSQVHVQFFSSRDTARRVLDLRGDGGTTEASLVDSFHEGGSTTVVRPQTLTLQSFPVDTVATFEVIYDPLQRFSGNDSFVIIPAINYVIDEDNGRLHLRYPMHAGRRRIRVTFTAGFAAAGTPATLAVDLAALGFEDLIQAAIIQTVFLFRKLDKENVGKGVDAKNAATGSRAQRGGDQFVKIGGLCPEAASLLTAYKSLLTGHR